MNFLKSDMEVVWARFKKPAIVSDVIMAIIIGMIVYQGNFVSFIERWEWVQAILIFFVLGAVMFFIDTVRVLLVAIRKIVYKA